MSDTNSGPENRFSSGPRKTGRLVRLKKLGIILFCTSVAAMGVISMFSLVSAKSGDGLILTLDPEAKDAHFAMSLSPTRGKGSGSGQGSEGGGSSEQPQSARLLVGEPLGNARQTTHEKVRQYYDANFKPDAEDPMQGSWNFVDEEGRSRALLFTFYLTNTSDKENQTCRVVARLNTELDNSPRAIGNRPYDYARLCLFTGYDLEEDDAMHYFGAANTKGLGTIEDPSDKRECLAAFGTVTDYGTDEEGNPTMTELRYPLYSDTFNGQSISYCEPFNTGSDGMGLFDAELDILPGKCRRITFVTYLEGDDPDGAGNAPSGQKLGFSLHIGI